MSETVTVTADAQNNITLDSGAISRGLDSQQLRDLPRNTRDIQSFLLLNPNVVGGSDTDIQFLGAKTYGVSYIQDGQASTNAIFGTVGNSAPGLDAVEEIRCCRTRSAPSTAALPASSSRRSAAATRITAPPSTTSTTTGSTR